MWGDPLPLLISEGKKISRAFPHGSPMVFCWRNWEGGFLCKGLWFCSFLKKVFPSLFLVATMMLWVKYLEGKTKFFSPSLLLMQLLFFLVPRKWHLTYNLLYSTLFWCLGNTFPYSCFTLLLAACLWLWWVKYQQRRGLYVARTLGSKGLQFEQNHPQFCFLVILKCDKVQETGHYAQKFQLSTLSCTNKHLW